MTVQTSSFARIGLLAGGRQATGTGVNQKSRIECETLAFDRLGDRIRGGPDSPRSCPQRSEPDLGRVLPPVGLMAGKAIYLLLPVQDWLASFISSLGNGQEKVTARQSTRPFAIAGLIPCEAATFPTSLTRGRNWSIPIFIWELRHFPVLFVPSRPSMAAFSGVQAPVICHLAVWQSGNGHRVWGAQISPSSRSGNLFLKACLESSLSFSLSEEPESGPAPMTQTRSRWFPIL